MPVSDTTGEPVRSRSASRLSETGHAL